MRILFYLVVIALLSGCSKDLSMLPHRKFVMPVAVSFRDVHAFSGSKFIVSGGDDGIGVIYKTSNGGISWEASITNFNNQINCLYFLNSDTGFCADSDILIYKTVDGGKNWNPFYGTSWPLTVNRHLRDIWFTTGTKGFVCGGKNYGNGVLYNTETSGSEWNFNEYAHEYRGICFKNEMNGVMCGYGSLLHTTDGGKSFLNTDNKTAYYTGICLDNSNNYWMCDFNGGVYTSTDGKDWQTLRESKTWKGSASQINCIAVSPSGKIACAGPNGFITWSNDLGNSWNDRESFAGNDILSISFINDAELIAVGKSGGCHVVLLE